MDIAGVTENQASAMEQLGYRLTERLARGAQDHTYRAICLDDDSRVIIRAVKHDEGPRAAARLEREFQLTRDLTVEGVSRPVVMESTGDWALLVFPDDRRETLDRYLDGRSMPLESFFEVGLQLVRILGRLHARNILHKDIKPAHILIDPATLSVELTGFGIAAVIASETALNLAPTELEGTLAYISPEQTGRMNRSIDARSDIYSLGISFYEMLTDCLPFQAEDPAELVHHHIARTPEEPRELNPAIPAMLSRLVMKMIAKDPEDRYQSAAGLEHDLQRVRSAFDQGGVQEDFETGTRDVSPMLVFPARLYGRDEALHALVRSVDKATSGPAVMVCVAGHSGIGKSALVREVMRPVAGRQGHFIAGKFDQLNRVTPYSAIVQAFDELVRLMLAESQERLDRLREDLLEALGSNAQVVMEVIPALEALLGEQPPVVPLGPGEAQIRFNVLFRRFMRALATPERPLVIFLDDLQWADAASLSLLEVLMTDSGIWNLLLICAYRDNEIGPGHPAAALFKVLEREGTEIQRITLPPLVSEYVSELVADTLRLPERESGVLAELVTEKTRGNPFFVRQFLQTLHDRGLLKFDPGDCRWRWNMDAIREEQITDNVVDLIAARIERLDREAQRLVQLGASIGNRFDLETLPLVSGMGVGETARGLEPAQKQQIVMPIGEAYKYADLSGAFLFEPKSVVYRFPHDRLQQAAYSTIDDADRAELHERIGRLLLERSGEEQIENRLFEIVNHLNLARQRFSTREEKSRLAELNLRAGKKAKSSTAYEAALDYFETGADLLGEKGWLEQVESTFDLHLQLTETRYLLGSFEEAEHSAKDLLGRAETTLQKSKVLDLLILTHTSALQYGEAIDVAVQALELLGEKIPRSPSTPQLLQELARARLAIGGKSISDLKGLPRMRKAEKLAAMRVLMLTTPPAYFDDPNLMPYLALRMVRLSLKYGNAAHSAYGYVAYGLVLCGVLNAMEKGREFGQLALDLVEEFNAQDIKGKVIMVNGGFIQHWKSPLRDSLPQFEKGAAASIEAGDLEFHGYNRYAYASYSYFSGMPLERVAEILEEQNAAVREHKHEKTDRIMRMAWEAVRDLRGEAAGPRPGDMPEFDEEANLTLWKERDRQAFAYFYLYALNRQYMQQDFEGCLESAAIIGEHLHAVMGMTYVVWYRTFESLALTALLPHMQSGRPGALRRVRANQRRLRKWSEGAPENYLHKYHLVTAELERIRGNEVKAEAAYEASIRLSREHGALHDHALAHELAGRFQLTRGQQTAGRAHLKEARSAYLQWGALAWVEALEQQHPDVFAGAQGRAGSEGRTDGVGTRSMIDLTTIGNSARAISEKMQVEDVLREVLDATVTHAGAARGLLLLATEGKLMIEAESSSGESALLGSRPFADSGEAPESLINYVVRVKKSVVLDDATVDRTFCADPYVAESKPLSVLCSPILDKGKLIGLLYLENRLVRGAFVPERVKMLDVLAAQAAISLENARLYQSISDYADALELRVKERTRELEDAYLKLREVFGKYVPRRVVESLVSGEGSLKPTQATATMLFSDIEGFTSIAERMPPEKVLQMLNEYFPTVIEPIDRNGGIVHQFQGDGMLVTFNLPIADPRHADKAVKTAAEIQRAVNNRTFAGLTLRTRIGVNTGEVTAGNVGSGDRVSYTVHGDAVNLSARIEQLNKEHGTYVLVSGTTVELLQDDYPLRAVGEVDIRGKTEPVTLYHLETTDQE
jgi:predicted ATPase/class 3 adenylate cyclase